MDIEPQNFYQLLKDYSKEDVYRGPTECLRLLNILNYNLTEEQLSSSLVDLYLLYTFDKNDGVLDFVLSITSRKEYEHSAAKALEIVYALINSFPQKVAQYVLVINEKCLKIVQSRAPAKVKTKALDVLLVSFEKIDKCLENQDAYQKIFDGIKNCLKLDHPDTVKQKEFMILGLFVKKFSYLITEPNLIKQYLIGQLDQEMNSKKSSGNIYGIFTALGYVCESFPLSNDKVDDKAYIDKLIKHIQFLTRIPQDRNKSGNRAALSFLNSNMQIFIKPMMQNWKWWHKFILNWLSMGVEEIKIGESVLKSYIIAVSEELNTMDGQECIPILKHFLNWLKMLLRKADASSIEKRLAIHGLKFFCSPMYKHLSKQESREIFLLIMQNFETTYVLKTDSAEDDWEYLPDYIQCVASFMRYQNFSTSELYCLQKALINLIKTFHRLKPLNHSFVIEAFVTTLFYMKKTKHFDTFLENVIFQGVIWTCSHQHITDSNLSGEFEDIVTVKNYFPLWRGVLKLTSNTNYDKYSIFLEDRKYILNKIIDQLVKTLMVLVNKLNVTVKPKADEDAATDIKSVYEVEHANDYAIFLNVTDFYSEAFSHIEPIKFRYCICKMINHFIAKCIKYPLISGFYKLVSMALKIANRLNLFDKQCVALSQDAKSCQETLSKFVMMLIQIMKQFKDELLISCLHVLLETPVLVIEPILLSCVSVFVNTFELGRSYLALANMALTTLERWQDDIDAEVYEEFIIQIVPSLDSYLRSKALGGMMQTAILEKKRKTPRALKKRTVLVELEPELIKFQKRIMFFIGSQNSKVCQAFVSPDYNIEENIIGNDLHLKIPLAYSDVTIDLFLDPLLLRVIELALYSSDRKTRVMACEVLQAMVMIFLGQTKQMPPSGLSNVDDIFRIICSTLLQLSCDIDQVVRQIFEPVFLQLIHWCTSPSRIGNSHYGVLVDVLTGGITHPSNTNIRDFAGKSIAELVKWNIKQSNENTFASMPNSVKVLCNIMRYYSTHPDLNKKVGAALIFNNIYRDVREERELLVNFTVEMLYTFITGLSLLKTNSEENRNVAVHINKTISHLKRIIVEKHKVFLKTDSDKIIAADLESNDLKGISKWLLLQCGSKSHFCRETSKDLFVHIAPLCGGNIRRFVSSNFNSVCTIFESHLSKCPTLFNITGPIDCVAVLKWMQSFLCAIDGYTFIIQNNLFDVSFEDSLLKSAINHFVKFVQNCSLGEILNTISKNDLTSDVSAIDKEQFLALKGFCSLAVLKLTHVVVKHIPYERSISFWNDEIFDFLKSTLFGSYSLGIDYSTPDSTREELLILMLNALPRKLPDNVLIKLISSLREYIGLNFEKRIDMKRNVSQKQRKIIKGLLLLQSSQLNTKFKAEEYSKGLIDSWMQHFYSYLEDNKIYISNMSDTANEYSKTILEFCLNNEDELKSFFKNAFKPYTVHAKEIEFDRITFFGVYFLIKFGDTIMKFIFEKPHIFFELADNAKILYQMSCYILNHIESSNIDKKIYAQFLDVLISKWPFLQIYFNDTAKDEGIELVKQLAKANISDRKWSSIHDWVLDIVLHDDPSLVEFEVVNLYVSVVYALIEIVGDTDSVHLSAALEKIFGTFQRAIAIKSENVIIVEKLASVLPKVKSLRLFTFIIELYETTSVIIDLTYLIKGYMDNNGTKHDLILNTTLATCADIKKTFEDKEKMYKNVLQHVFKNSNLDEFESFARNNFESVVDQIEDIADLGRGILYFGLLEYMFARLKFNERQNDEEGSLLNGKNQDVVQKAFKSISHCLGAPKEGNKNQIRKYKCSAYKALASIILNAMQSSEQYYSQLFCLEQYGSDILWDSLIDTNLTFNFSMEFDSFPKQRKELITIRSELAAQNSRNSTKSFKYIESQRLFSSSLSEDVTKFDFTNSVLRTVHYRNGDENQLFTQNQIVLDGTEVNDHECMATVCGLIEHLYNSGLCPLPDSDQEMQEIPEWMEGIRKLLLDQKVHRNIKIFWIKVIDNAIGIFRHFARTFMEPLLRFIVDKNAGDDINYFVSDVIVIVSTWSAQVAPNEVEARLSSEVLKFLVQKINNERDVIFKYHLELIKIIVENWKNFVKVPYEELLTKFRYPINDRKIEGAIHLTSVFLVNRLRPFEERKINEFWDRLLEILDSNVSSIYKPCAETLGLMLKLLQLEGLDDTSYANQASKIILKYDCEISKYAKCLEGIAIHYPGIVDNFHLTKIFNRLLQSDADLKKSFLKIINKRVDVMSEISDFRNEDWIKYLDNESNEIQLLAMNIMHKCYQILKFDDRFLSIVKVICKNLASPNILCRIKMYDILMVLISDNDINRDVASLCREVLIQGLVDPDVEIREKLRQFWSENPMIPSHIATKFPFLLDQFYLSKCEDHFLSYTSYFLLESIKEDDLERELFEHPLEDCDFEEYKLQTNWRLQHPSVVPLFAETLRTFTEDLEDAAAENFGRLRQTQTDFSFVPTQQTLREREISQRMNLGSSLMISTFSNDDEFLDPNRVHVSEKYKLPKKRFLKDKAKVAQSFAHVAVGKKIQREVRRYESIKEGEKRVTIFRNYRKGDFPDIQITVKAVVKPLQMLVMHDIETAQILFMMTFKSLVEKVRNKSEFMESIFQGIKHVFTSSFQFNPKVFSTLLEIILQNKRDLFFDPTTISTVCRQSGLVSIGSLVLEEYLISGDFEAEASTSKRATTTPTSSEQNYWIRLAELYREMQEWDLVKTIFTEKTNCKEDVYDAIRYESNKKWRKAEKQYKNLLKNDPMAERNDFYYESLFKCLANLGEWREIPKLIEEGLPPDNNYTSKWEQLWSNEWNQQKLLPWYIEGQVKSNLFSETSSADFLNNINKSLSMPDQAEHLRNRFSEQLCALWLTHKDTSQSSRYLKDAMNTFLSEWQLLSPMFHNTRYNRILVLRNLVDIQRFLSIESDFTEESTRKLQKIQDFWKATINEHLPSIALNETKLLYRRLFIRVLSENPDRQYNTDLINELKKTKILLDIEFMNKAIDEENPSIAKKFYQEYAGKNHSKLKLILGNILYLSGNLEDEPANKVERYLKALENFGEILNNSKEKLYHLKSAIKFFDTSEALMGTLQENQNLYIQKENKIKEIFGDVHASPTDTAAEKLKSLILEEGQDFGKDQLSTVVDAQIKLAYFIKDIEGREKEFVRLVLKAMQLNSSEARQLFPCILMKDGLATDLRDIFLQESSKVPTWMFLGWIPQLLAVVDSDKVGTVSKILLDIANTYPQAIMYAYRLSKENFKFVDPRVAIDARSLVEKLDVLLMSDPLVDTFLEGLSKVNLPLITLGYYVSKLYNCKNDNSFAKAKESLLKDLYTYRADSRDSTSMHGVIYKDIECFKKYFNSLSSNLSISSRNDILRKVDSERSALVSKRKNYLVKLKEYCPWLASFSAGKMNAELEIPGQYTGNKMPLTQHHVKISGFGQTVNVMSSKTKPIRITMLGMDSKEYPFLIKFGEDVRQDQRIEQLFTLMNDIFANDHKPHRILTYQIIPLTSSLGIIQWIDNSISLEEFLKKTIKSQRNDVFSKLLKNYVRFLENGPNYTDIYGKTAIKYKDKRHRVVANYRALVNEVPLDVLRTSFWNMSMTTESFIAYKNNFIKSYAILCVCQWILGIGDRHLQNSKVCTKNGQVLGIDFGLAFGAATQFQPVPELIPIRLTPHIVGLMEPLKERGSFRDVMIDCIKSLRGNRESLLATMDVFAKEPSVDWLEHANKLGGQMDNPETHEWYPNQKIDQARRKLMGASSTDILVEDLSNRKRNQYIDTYIQLVKDSTAYKRHQLSHMEYLSVENQIDSLIDHATDDCLLGLTWQGWYPWM